MGSKLDRARFDLFLQRFRLRVLILRGLPGGIFQTLCFMNDLFQCRVSFFVPQSECSRASRHHLGQRAKDGMFWASILGGRRDLAGKGEHFLSSNWGNSGELEMMTLASRASLSREEERGLSPIKLNRRYTHKRKTLLLKKILFPQTPPLQNLHSTARGSHLPQQPRQGPARLRRVPIAQFPSPSGYREKVHSGHKTRTTNSSSFPTSP